MEGIEFEKESYGQQINRTVGSTQKSFFVRFLIKLSGGRIKTERQASVILVFIAFLFLIISMYNFSVANGTKKKISQEELLRVQKLMDEHLKNGANYSE